VSWISLALVLLAARALGAMRPMRAEPTAAAATALVVLLMGYSDDGAMLLARLGDTFIGIAVGLVVNLAVWPPLRDRSAARRIDDLDDRLGALLADMASGLRSGDAPEPDRWVERTRELDHSIDDAWADVRQARESGRLNLRRHAARRIQDTRNLGDVLVGLEQAVADTRSMARTIARAGAVADWEPRFRDAWVTILARAADAVRDANADDVRRAGADLESVARRLPDSNGERAPAGPRRARSQPAEHPGSDGPGRRRPTGPRPLPLRPAPITRALNPRPAHRSHAADRLGTRTPSRLLAQMATRQVDRRRSATTRSTITHGVPVDPEPWSSRWPAP
jgi:uncharacterized membrane protein YccC